MVGKGVVPPSSLNVTPLDAPPLAVPLLLAPLLLAPLLVPLLLPPLLAGNPLPVLVELHAEAIRQMKAATMHVTAKASDVRCERCMVSSGSARASWLRRAGEQGRSASRTRSAMRAERCIARDHR
jgi:hypothetical protein